MSLAAASGVCGGRARCMGLDGRVAALVAMGVLRFSSSFIV